MERDFILIEKLSILSNISTFLGSILQFNVDIFTINRNLRDKSTNPTRIDRYKFLLVELHHLESDFIILCQNAMLTFLFPDV